MPARILPAGFSFVRRSRQRIFPYVILILVISGCGAMAQAATATTTTLAVSPSSSPLAAKTVVTLTATVLAGGTPIHPGLVTFCDAATAAQCKSLAVLGTAQLTSAGTAVLKYVPGGGSHNFVAVFAGTATYATSSSTVQALAVSSAYATTTSITSSGSAGNYTLTATVTTAGGPPSISGDSVSFLDTTNSNSLGTATLGVATITPQLSGPAVAAGNGPDAVAIADFNGDGIADMAVTNFHDQDVGIFLGNGSGGFTAAPGSPFGAGDRPVSMAVGDFNGDGVADLVVGNLGNTVNILLGNGSGGFTAATGSPITGIGNGGVATGDFNGDGIADLAVSNASSNNVSVLLGNGSGGFTPAAGSPVAAGTGAGVTAIADFNGDGIADLAVTNSNNYVSVLLGNGSGGFAPAPGSPVAVGTSPSFSIATGDFNGDGIADLAVTNFNSNNVSILLGNGSGGFAPAPGSPVAVGTNPDGVAIGDFNDDGIVDLAVANYSNGDVSILLGNGNGRFTPAAGSPIAVGSLPETLAVGDFNGDGQADLAVPNEGGTTVNIMLNQMTQTAAAVLPGVSVPGTGIHYVDATYAETPNFTSSTSTKIPLNATQIPTSLALTATPSSSTYGQQVMLTAVLSPFSSGSLTTNDETVTFYNGPTILGTGILSSGLATLNITNLPLGTNSLTAVYGGDTDFLGSSAPAISQTVNRATLGQNGLANITLVSSPNPSAFAQLVIFTATVPSGVTGTVQFVDGTIVLGTATIRGTAATYTTNTLALGTHAMTAVYSGDANYYPATSAVYNQVVTMVASSTTTLSVAPTTVMYGNPTTLTAVVAPSFATGTVSFYEGTILLGTASLDNTSIAVLPISTLNAGSHSIVAKYNGDPIVPASTSNTVQLTVTQRTAPGGGPAITVTVNDASRTTTQSNPPFTYSSSGQLVNGDTYATAISGTPTYSTAAGSAPGTYSVTISGLASANYTIASVSGDLTVTISPSSTMLVASPASPQYGDLVTLTAAVTSGATGGVSFYDGSVLLGTGTVSNGIATLTTTALTAGTHTITAVYNGDATYASSQSVPTTVTVAKKTAPGGGAALTIAVQNASRPYGTADPQFSYVVTGTTVNGDTYTTAITGNPIYSSVDTPTSYAGSTFPINVSGLSSANYEIAIVPGTLTIVAAPTRTTLTSSVNSAQYGDPVTLTATVAPSGATGNVVFMNGSTVLGIETVLSGVATLTTRSLSAGSYTITSSYQGDANYGASTSGPVLLNITPRIAPGGGAALTVTVNNASRIYGQGNSAFSYTVTGTLVNGDTYATAVTGVPVYSTTAISLSPAGTYPISVAGLNSNNYVMTFINGALTVAKATLGLNGLANMTLVSAPNPSIDGQSVTFTATVPNGVTGTVVFYDGTTVLGTSTIANGIATLTTSTLAVGSHPVTAAYTGDDHYNSATSAAYNQMVTAQAATVLDFTLTLTSARSQTVIPGNAASYTVQVAPTNTTYPGTVIFSATGLPPGATISFTPATVAANAGPTQSNVSVQTTAQTTAMNRVRNNGAPLALALLLLPFLSFRRMRGSGRRYFFILLVLLGGIAATTGLTGCGAHNGFFGQVPKTYNITITATSGTVQHSADVTLNVQ